MLHVCRRLQDARLRRQQRPTDSLDQLITELISENPHQSNSDNIVQIADTVTHSSVQTDCQQYVVSSDGEKSLQSEDEQRSPSLICAEEEPSCQPLQKSSVEQGVTNVQQICLKEQCVFTGSVKQKGGNGDGALYRKNMQQDILAGNIVNGNCVQEMAEEIDETYAEFAAGVATGSNAWDCTSTHSIGDQNTNAVRNVECMGDVEMSEVESLTSEILPASEVDDLDSPHKFPSFRLGPLRYTEISNYDEAETSVISDVSSDASTIILIGHDSVSTSMQRSCEDGGSSDSKAVACTDEDEDMECHSAELHSGVIGCKQKFASG
jgi:hypothetical protein